MEHDILKDFAFFVSSAIFVVGVGVGAVITVLINMICHFIRWKDGTD